MSVVLAERFTEHRELAAADPELRLNESAALVPDSLRESVLANAPAQPPGTELLQIIRPGIGRGRGRRYYSPNVLRESARLFSGKRMFLNHETDKQRRERESLPRRVEDLGGRIVEAWWDGSVSSDNRFEQGAVFGWVKPVGVAKQLIDEDPEIMEASISALATSIQPGRIKGQSCTIVEGIRPTPITVDWIAGEGGAGGRLLTEAAEEEAVLESMADQEIEEYLERERPGLLEALREDANGDSGGGNHNRREDDMAELSPEVLSEALASDEGKQAIATAVKEALAGVEFGSDPDEVKRLVEAEVSERVDLAKIDASAEFDRKVELRDMRDKAQTLVREAKLHPLLAKQIEERYTLAEDGEPSPALNIGPDTDDEGNVTKPALEKLAEAVTTEIEDARKLQADLRPTQVRGQGRAASPVVRENATNGDSGDGDKKETPKAKPTTGSPLTDELLEESGFKPDSLGSLWAPAT
jgi:hypothetical protein